MKSCLILLLSGLLLASGALAYDGDLARGYAQMFAPATGPTTPKALHLMKTSAFIEAVKKQEKMLILDVRTPAEVAMVQMGLPDVMAIPMDQLFKPENLERLPTDRKIVVVCKGGHRAVAVATGLRHIGFENTFVLKLGLVDLAGKINPKTAP